MISVNGHHRKQLKEAVYQFLIEGVPSPVLHAFEELPLFLIKTLPLREYDNNNRSDDSGYLSWKIPKRQREH